MQLELQRHWRGDTSQIGIAPEVLAPSPANGQEDTSVTFGSEAAWQTVHMAMFALRSWLARVTEHQESGAASIKASRQMSSIEASVRLQFAKKARRLPRRQSVLK